MTGADILARVERMLAYPAIYDRRHTAGNARGETNTLDKSANVFCLTGLIERAAAQLTPTITLCLKVGDRQAIHEAKMLLCRHVGAIHLSGWEAQTKPTAQALRTTIGEVLTAMKSREDEQP